MTYPFSVAEVQALEKIKAAPRIIDAADGKQLVYYSFLPNNGLSALVIIYHGAGIYSNNAYRWVGWKLQQSSTIGAYCIDIRGHGSSGGKRGDAPSSQHVVADVETVIRHIAQLHPGVPIYLVGHSSGAGLILNYSNSCHPAIAGYIFLAPYWGEEAQTQRPIAKKRSFIKKIRKWVMAIARLSKGRIFAHTPAIFFNYPLTTKREDPLILPSYTYTLLSGIIPENPQALFAKLGQPFALYVGQHDEQFLPEKVIRLSTFAPEPIQQNSLVSILPNVKHVSILISAPELIKQAIEHFQTKQKGHEAVP